MNTTEEDKELAYSLKDSMIGNGCKLKINNANAASRPGFTQALNLLTWTKRTRETLQPT